MKPQSRLHGNPDDCLHAARDVLLHRSLISAPLQHICIKLCYLRRFSPIFLAIISITVIYTIPNADAKQPKSKNNQKSYEIVEFGGPSCQSISKFATARIDSGKDVDDASTRRGIEMYRQSIFFNTDGQPTELLSFSSSAIRSTKNPANLFILPTGNCSNWCVGTAVIRTSHPNSIRPSFGFVRFSYRKNFVLIESPIYVRHGLDSYDPETAEHSIQLLSEDKAHVLSFYDTTVAKPRDKTGKVRMGAFSFITLRPFEESAAFDACLTNDSTDFTK